MPTHGDVRDDGLVWCDTHAAYVDVADRHLDGVMNRPPLLREIPHCIVGQVSELRCTCPECVGVEL